MGRPREIYLGALATTIFTFLFGNMGKMLAPLEYHTILLATLGGLSIGLIALAFPQTLFFSEASSSKGA
ncbi:MAG: hypothetical protein EBE86_025365 [Hormoscilla sp. GUM202]|nr:hypothetical protein [Hormoscilla sp. GUM202]